MVRRQQQQLKPNPNPFADSSQEGPCTSITETYEDTDDSSSSSSRGSSSSCSSSNNDRSSNSSSSSSSDNCSSESETNLTCNPQNQPTTVVSNAISLHQQSSLPLNYVQERHHSQEQEHVLSDPIPKKKKYRDMKITSDDRTNTGTTATTGTIATTNAKKLKSISNKFYYKNIHNDDDEDKECDDCETDSLHDMNNYNNDTMETKSSPSFESISLEAMKEQILGRKLISSSLNDDYINDTYRQQQTPLQEQTKIQYQSSTGSKKNDSNNNVAVQIRNDFICPICYEIYYEPISLLCGHTFCYTCINWWLNTSKNHNTITTSASTTTTATSTTSSTSFQHNHSNNNNDFQTPKLSCPACRQIILLPTTMSNNGNEIHDASSLLSCSGLGINRTIQVCIETFFIHEIQHRIQAKDKLLQKSVAGENNGHHSNGYITTHPLNNSDMWHTIRLSLSSTSLKQQQQNVHVRRSIVMDSDDQRMRLCLAFVVGEDERATTTTSLSFHVCLLHMEEDEIEDDNVDSIPWIITSRDDAQWITTEERFRSSPIQVTAITKKSQISSASGAHRNNHNNNNNDGTPIIQRFANSDGIVQIPINQLLSSSNTVNNNTKNNANVHYFSLVHEETGCTIHILPLKLDDTLIFHDDNATNYKKTITRIGETEKDMSLVNSSTVNNNFFFSEDDCNHEEQSEDSEENDSFIASSDNDDDDTSDDVCHICHDGGHMIVCDGGDQFPHDCGNMFHLECIHRTEIPPGDWICQDCTNKYRHMIIGLNHAVGIEGYEFKPITKAKIETTDDSEPQRKRVLIRDDFLSTQSDNESIGLNDSSPEATNKKIRSKSKGKENHSHSFSNTSDSCCVTKPVGKRRCVLDSDDESTCL